jgi:rhodanese-related sulfurtransferase
MTLFIGHNAPMKILLFLFMLTSCLPSKPEQVADKGQWVDQMAQTVALKYKDVEFIRPEVVQKLLEEKTHILLVDARSREEQKVSTLPYAISIEDDLSAHSSAHLIYYCTIGERSGAQALKALSQNKARVSVLSGGILSWAHTGGEFTDSQGNPTKQVHVFSKAWDFLPEDHHAIFP